MYTYRHVNKHYSDATRQTILAMNYIHIYMYIYVYLYMYMHILSI